MGFSAVFIACLGMAITLTAGNWTPMSAGQIATLAIAAFFLFFGYQFIVLSMRTGEIAYVVPYRYTALLWAILFGYLVFDEVPDAYTLIGSAIVVSMSAATFPGLESRISSVSMHSPGLSLTLISLSPAILQNLHLFPASCL